MLIYMAVTSDEYELPVASADSLKELAKMLNTTANALSSSMCKQKNGKYNGYKVVLVEIEEYYDPLGMTPYLSRYQGKRTRQSKVLYA